jgi:hypothetical protein
MRQASAGYRRLQQGCMKVQQAVAGGRSAFRKHSDPLPVGKRFGDESIGSSSSRLAAAFDIQRAAFCAQVANQWPVGHL